MHRNEVLKATLLAFGCTLVLWLVFLFQFLTETELFSYGIFPRSIHGIKGIFLAPFLHSDLNHIYSNSVPYLLLTGATFYFYPKNSWKILILIWILTDSLVWGFARPHYHIGASGIVNGMVSFHFFSGIFRKNKASLALSFLVFFLYNGILIGIFPGNPSISWESHLYGLLTGIFVAFLFRKKELPPPKYDWMNENYQENVPEDFFIYDYKNKPGSV